jgi:hypothetical protein
LEIGCCDTDWLTMAHQYDPSILPVGLDWRAPRKGPGKRIRGDVLTVTLPPASLDAIVMLSTLEHIGLGHYDHDPQAEDGDTRTLARCVEWLKPGGWVYADVPYNPAGYQVYGTKCRIYDDAALAQRLAHPALDGAAPVFTDLRGDVLPRPAIRAPLPGGRAYIYVALLWRKRLPDGEETQG